MTHGGHTSFGSDSDKHHIGTTQKHAISQIHQTNQHSSISTFFVFICRSNTVCHMWLGNTNKRSSSSINRTSANNEAAGLVWIIIKSCSSAIAVTENIYVTDDDYWNRRRALPKSAFSINHTRRLRRHRATTTNLCNDGDMNSLENLINWKHIGQVGARDGDDVEVVVVVDARQYSDS